MDIALTIDRLVPAAAYTGSVTCGSQASFNNLTWADERTKPTWTEMETEWAVVVGEQEYAAALEECYTLRRAAYDAKGWIDAFQLMDDVFVRGLVVVAAERQEIKDLYPLP